MLIVLKLIMIPLDSTRNWRCSIWLFTANRLENYTVQKSSFGWNRIFVGAETQFLCLGINPARDGVWCETLNMRLSYLLVSCPIQLHDRLVTVQGLPFFFFFCTSSWRKGPWKFYALDGVLGVIFSLKRLEQVAQTPVLGNIVNWVPYGFWPLERWDLVPPDFQS